MTGHAEKVLEISIVQSIEHLHAIVEIVTVNFLANKNLKVNDIWSIGVKETIVTWTLEANPISIVGANPIVAMGVDIIEMDTTSNLK